ncbi:hypothetical protein B1S06_14230 [Rhodopseudomonas palustris]|nr:hypothetical protein B1S06_14230 [Rhodopseudomonas palustris]
MPIANREDLERLIAEGIEESLTLEYKASPSLCRESKQIDELCKDVSAFANSAGGQIVYGVAENKVTHKPERVDEGVLDPKVTREWIEQVLLSRVNPRMQGIKVDRLDLGNLTYGYCLTIPPTSVGPHQAPDKRYYKRYDLQSIPMEDYEVRDVLRRSTTPSLRVNLTLGGVLSYPIVLENSEANAELIPIKVSILNESETPAFHVVTNVLVSSEYSVTTVHTKFDQCGVRSRTERLPDMRILRTTIASPPGVPVFREADPDIHLAGFYLSLTQSQAKQLRLLIDVEVQVRAPGFSSVEYWALYKQGRYLTVAPPGSAMALDANTQ